MLAELAKREKQAGIFPEKDVDIYMKVSACHSLIYIMCINYLLQPPKHCFNTMSCTIRRQQQWKEWKAASQQITS
jgi:hypothetical protein